jgi:hypothetical protein
MSGLAGCLRWLAKPITSLPLSGKGFFLHLGLGLAMLKQHRWSNVYFAPLPRWSNYASTISYCQVEYAIIIS